MFQISKDDLVAALRKGGHGGIKLAREAVEELYFHLLTLSEKVLTPDLLAQLDIVIESARFFDPVGVQKRQGRYAYLLDARTQWTHARKSNVVSLYHQDFTPTGEALLRWAGVVSWHESDLPYPDPRDPRNAEVAERNRAIVGMHDEWAKIQKAVVHFILENPGKFKSLKRIKRLEASDITLGVLASLAPWQVNLLAQAVLDESGNLPARPHDRVRSSLMETIATGLKEAAKVPLDFFRTFGRWLVGNRETCTT